jgi:putative oxygen-independent coproporphyrinogen III oxidase
MSISGQKFPFISEKILKKPLSIYIHWPFCLSKCPYCDFNSHVSNDINWEEWLDAYLTELDYFLNVFDKREVKSIYFGGGTPSLMNPRIVHGILDFLSKKAVFSKNIEITLEANPTSSEYSKFQEFKSAGVNRVSIGIQALNPEDLKFLGRQHSVQDGVKAIDMARKIFDRYSFDLIYARPGQTSEAWGDELKEAIKMADDHISLYQLTIEKGTMFHQMYKKNAFVMPDDDLSNELYFLTDSILKDYGFQKYEVSNYAKNRKYSKHNMCYWQYDDYLGIGPGAHSRIRSDLSRVMAFNQVYQPKTWVDSVKNTGNGVQKLDILAKNDLISEFILTGLRLKTGIKHSNAMEKIGQPVENLIKKDVLNFLLNEKLIKIDEYTFKTTEKGFRLLNYVVTKILDGLI